jgi:hypothetical protein
MKVRFTQRSLLGRGNPTGFTVYLITYLMNLFLPSVLLRPLESALGYSKNHAIRIAATVHFISLWTTLVQLFVWAAVIFVRAIVLLPSLSARSAHIVIVTSVGDIICSAVVAVHSLFFTRWYLLVLAYRTKRLIPWIWPDTYATPTNYCRVFAAVLTILTHFVTVFWGV